MFSNISTGRRYATTVLIGIFWALPFLIRNTEGCAIIVPGILLFITAGTPGSLAFRLGFTAGLVQSLASFYWILNIPMPGEGSILMRSGPVFGWFALSTYLALYPAFWVLGCWRMFPGRGYVSAQNAATFDNIVLLSTRSVLTWSLSCAALWVALEIIRARLITGFPWNLLGCSFFQAGELLAIARYTGVYGISFGIVWVSICMVLPIMRSLPPADQGPGWRELWPHLKKTVFSIEYLRIPLIAGGSMAFILFLAMLSPGDKADRFLKIALVQPAIPQTSIWDPAENERRFQKLLDLSEEALKEKPDLLVWPEAAVPRFNEATYQSITNLAITHKVSMIFGADDSEVTPTATNYYNSSFLFNAEGKFVETYRKRFLVIFGEYVPLSGALPFLKYLTPITGGFSSGKRAVPFKIQQPLAKIGVLICFEDNFPHLAREYADEETDFLLNLTNNGWFGEGAAQWQHAANAVFRAIENGRPLVRCTNNGLTCWIDRDGRIQQIFRGREKGVYDAGFLIIHLPLAPRGSSSRTFYNRYGDVFGWSCTIISGGMILFSIWNSRSHREGRIKTADERR